MDIYPEKTSLPVRGWRNTRKLFQAHRKPDTHLPDLFVSCKESAPLPLDCALGPRECHLIRPELMYGRMAGWGQSDLPG